MRAEGLAISVEAHSPQYAEALHQARLVYRVVRSSRRWVYLTDYLPFPVAEATARFLQKNVLPEMLLEHLDTTYEDIPDEDRLAVFQDNLDYLQRNDFTHGTRALIQPSLEEQRGLSIEGWLRFRGRAVLGELIGRLASEGLKSMRLERAFLQFRGLRAHPVDHLVIEGEGNELIIKDASGTDLFREFLDGYLDPRLRISREDLAFALIRALHPEQVEMERVTPDFRRRVEGSLGHQPPG